MSIGDADGHLFQPVKERQFSLCESWRFSRIKEEIGQKNKEIRAAPLPEGQFFEIHSSIFKPHPSRSPGQTSVVCVTHAALSGQISDP